MQQIWCLCKNKREAQIQKYDLLCGYMYELRRGEAVLPTEPLLRLRNWTILQLIRMSLV